MKNLRKKHPFISIYITTIVVLIVVLIVVSLFGGYLYGWNWTGFGSFTSPPHANNEVFQREKTLWDWFQLIFIPLVLAIAGFWFNHNEREAAELRADNERKAAVKRADIEREIAESNQREAALQDYMDKMSELLLHEGLGKSQSSSDVGIMARARTLTVLFRLDGKRKCLVLLFLHESRLIKKGNFVLDLESADFSTTEIIRASLLYAELTKANFTSANFHGSDLRFSILNGADFHKADLSEANFGSTELADAKLDFACLSRTKLHKAYLNGATLDFANLHNANLQEAILINASLIKADLSYANLTHADLSNANLTDANLTNADLSNANLTDALITPEQWDKARSLKGATMPSGLIHS